MSRSCQSATFSSAATTLPRTTRASPQIRSATIGFRLCGIADEPFWPRPNGSCTSRTSVRARWRISVANRSSDAARSAERRDDLGVPVALEDLRRASAPARARAARRRSARPPARLRRTGRRRRRACRRACPRAPARRRARSRSSANAQPASLSPNVVGSACTPCVRPILSVSRCSSARATTAANARSSPSSRSAPASPDLQRERRVDDVRRREPVVEPAPLRAERLGDRVDERRDVVVRLRLELGDPLGRQAALPARGCAATASAGTAPISRPPVERGQLDLQPARELRLLRPDPAHGRAGVAGDHRAILGAAPAAPTGSFGPRPKRPSLSGRRPPPHAFSVTTNCAHVCHAAHQHRVEPAPTCPTGAPARRSGQPTGAPELAASAMSRRQRAPGNEIRSTAA